MKVLPIVNKFLKNTKKNIPYGSSLIVACSGGADSVALTDVLTRLSEEMDLKLTVVHVEHGIRGEESLRDAAFTQRFCQDRGLSFVCRHVDALKLAGEAKQSLEEAARNLRYQVLQEEFNKMNADFIVTAHHADDQAETFLLRMLRGGGSSGLGAIKERNGNVLRPFLRFFRSEVEEYCQACALEYCMDSTNEDTSYLRNNVRKNLLPCLQELNPNIKYTLLREAELLQADSECLDEIAAIAYRELVKKDNGAVTCNTDKLLAKHKAVSGRVVRMMLCEASGGAEINYDHVDAVLKTVAANKSGKTLSLPACDAYYAYGKLSISKRAVCDAKPDDDRKNDVLSSIELSDIKTDGYKMLLSDGSVLVLNYIEGLKTEQDKYTVLYPWELLQGPLQIRYRQNGDIFFPYGSSGKKKLKDYFIDAKIEYDLRNSQILLADGKNILWLIGSRSAGWHKKDEPPKAWLAAKLLR